MMGTLKIMWTDKDLVDGEQFEPKNYDDNTIVRKANKHFYNKILKEVDKRWKAKN